MEIGYLPKVEKLEKRELKLSISGRIKRIINKPIELYSNAYVEHPFATAAATIAIQTLIGSYLGHEIGVSQQVVTPSVKIPRLVEYSFAAELSRHIERVNTGALWGFMASLVSSLYTITGLEKRAEKVK